MKRKILNFTAAALVLLTVLFACTRDIVDIAVDSVTLNSEPAKTLNINESLSLVATVAPDNASDPSVTWTSSNPAVATVTPDAATPSHATVTAVAPGTAVITVTAVDNPSKTATCTVTVNSPVTGISLNKTTMVLEKPGSKEQLFVKFTPDNASNKAVKWEVTNNAPVVSGSTVVVVDQEGNVTAYAFGTATITVTSQDGTKPSATCSVTVGALVTAITLNKTTLDLERGKTDNTLVAIVLPDNASNKTVEWTSSNPNIAQVNRTTGLVTALAPGKANITATAMDGSGKSSLPCEVNVTVPLANLVLDKDTMIMRVGGGTRQLTPIPTPSDATIGYNWTSSNTAVATVTQTGIVTAVSPGKATIVAAATVGGKVATCEVTVQPNTVAVTGVQITPDTLALLVSQTSQLSLIFNNGLTDPTNKTVDWDILSGSPTGVASVSTSGVVTGVAPGTTFIIVTTEDGNKTDTCKVVVRTQVTLNNELLNMTVGDISTLKATVNPSTTAVTWSSSDTSKATVTVDTNGNGKVTAVASGLATITVTTDDGSTATCLVRVST